MEWLVAKSLLGAPRWLLGVILILALVWGGTALIGALDRHDSSQRQAGAAQQREADLSETLNRTEQGNDARLQVRDPRSRARYDQCLRSARTPENCQRFLPQ